MYGAVEGAPVQRALDEAPTARQGVEGALRANASDGVSRVALDAIVESAMSAWII